MSLLKKQLVGFFLSVNLLCALALIPLLYCDYRARMEVEEERGRLALTLAAENLADSVSLSKAYSYVLGLSRQEGYQLTLANKSGLVFLDSWGEEGAPRDVSQLQEITSALSGTLGRSERYIPDKGEVVYLATQVERRDIILRLGIPLSEAKKGFYRQLGWIALGVIWVSLALTGLVFWLLRRNQAPFRQMSFLIDELTAGRATAISSPDFAPEWRPIFAALQRLNLVESQRGEEYGWQAMQKFVRQSSLSSLLVDRLGKIAAVSAALPAILGRPVAEGEPVAAVLSSPELLRQLHVGKTAKRISYHHQGRELEIHFLPWAKGALLAIIDISAESREEKLFSETASFIIHELRTPLTVMKGYLERLEEMELPAPAERAQKAISRNLVGMERMVSNINLVKSLDSTAGMHKEAINLASVFGELEELFAPRAKENGLRLGFFAPGKLAVFADRFLLFQALANLIENALEYTAQGGVTVVAHRNKKNIVIEVKDTGAGIAGEELAKIFRPFYRGSSGVERRSRGMGLGLSIVRRIVLLHGGDVQVKSALGKGTTFSVILPENEGKTDEGLDADNL
jgi:two-component system phosphate regulon sensor histidine kinase PhoR